MSTQMVDKLSLDKDRPAATRGLTPICSLLGEQLMCHKGEVETASVSGPGKYVCLYFSAHWCPPCRAFTPKLIKFYKAFKALKNGSSGLEIVFVSSDKTEEQFKEYFSEMPWKAVPYEQRDTKSKLGKKYKVAGIPKLIILDGETGELVNGDAVQNVQSDPHGAKFPWKPPAIAELCGGPVVNWKGEQKPFEEVAKGKITCVYFSAHWCPPCRQFTPALADFYNRARGTPQEFEVVFVSSDRGPESFTEYLTEMPWWAIPFDGTAAQRAALSERFEVQTIPKLVVLSEGAEKVITLEGTPGLRADPQGADFPWAPRPVEKLSANAVPILNRGEKCFVLFTDDFTPAGVQHAEDLMINTALPEFTKDEPDAKFFVADAAFKLSEQLLSMLGLSKSKLPTLVMLTLPEYAVAPAADTPEDVSSFVAACTEGQVEIRSLES